MKAKGTVIAVCTSERKGIRKRNVGQAELRPHWGVVGEARLEVTQIGKVCHERCAIYYQAGDCVMPREGIFARVHEGGRVQVGDAIEVLSCPPASPAAEAQP